MHTKTKAWLQRSLLGMGAVLWFPGLVAVASASGGIQGACVDCHTMHNSEQGAAVAKIGTSGTVSVTPVQNLLRYDCIACHAQGGGEKIVTLPGGSVVPQVYHNDATGDLAAGNFAYITGLKTGSGDASNRKGHNVVDVVPADSTFTNPPGFRHAGGNEFDVSKFTCAGQMGCHGFRGQLLYIAGDELNGYEFIFRTGLAALSGYEGSATFTLIHGAHHSNYDGLKRAVLHQDFYSDPLAHSYRFIRFLRGYGNETDRWQNKDASSHNEYSGGYVNDTLKNENYASTTNCSRCHAGVGTGGTTSRLTVPNSTMTGFCSTCHSDFHSSGATNGTSGAFLRHPSDYVIKNSAEYDDYTNYSSTAPVARPLTEFVDGFAASPSVRPGTDMVMCLSCHKAHASEYNSMLRFDYEAVTSGMRAGDGNQTHAGVGCLACHTAKGGPMP